MDIISEVINTELHRMKVIKAIAVTKKTGSQKQYDLSEKTAYLSSKMR